MPRYVDHGSKNSCNEQRTINEKLMREDYRQSKEIVAILSATCLWNNAIRSGDITFMGFIQSIDTTDI